MNAPKDLLASLNKTFSIKNSISFNSGPGDLPQVTVTHKSGGQLKIFLLGAHVASWKPNNSQEVFYMSPNSQFKEGTAIRGGIPLCFPQFSKDGPITQPHGFARTSMWSIKSTLLGPKGELEINFNLSPNSLSQSLWPNNDFEAVLSASLSENLSMKFTVKNLGKSSFSFNNAFHSYFNISSIENVFVKGLQGLRFIDKMKDNQDFREEHEKLSITAATDRVYRNAPDYISIADPGFKREIVLEKSNQADAIVWNPWDDGAKKIADLGESNHKNFICLEAGNATRSNSLITLQPEESFQCMQRISVGPLI